MPEAELLKGLRVLEIAVTVRGAYCGLLLSQLGAEVTRVRLPLVADCPPEYADGLARSLHQRKSTVDGDPETLSAQMVRAFDLVITDCLHDDESGGLGQRLAERVIDVGGATTTVIDVVRPPTFRASVPSAPAVVSAASGMSWGIGRAGEAPLTLPYDLPDYLAATEAAGAAALTALLRQVGSNPGRRWSVSATEVVASYVGQISSVFLPYGRPWTRDGARATMSGGSYPGAMFPCRDGNISIMCRTNREWHALLDAMGHPEWSSRPGYDDARVVARQHADEVDRWVRAWTAEHTTDAMTALGKQFNFPVATVLTVQEAIALNRFSEGRLFGTAPGGVPAGPWMVHEPRPNARRIPTQRRLALEPRAGKPLHGLRVLDLSWVWSGPMCTAALADLGAEIIKIEHRGRPDPARLRGRALRDGRPIDGPELELSTYFNQMNRGKRSVSIDITTERGVELVLDLAERCDVVVENMRPGALTRRGLDYAAMSARNPGIVMLSMSMMGQTGPLREIGGYAPVMSGLSGLDSLVGYGAEDLIGLYNPALGDPNGAAHALVLLLAALRRRVTLGAGCWLDVSEVECFMSLMRTPIVIAEAGQVVSVPANSHQHFPVQGTFRAFGTDEWVTVAARGDGERRAIDELVADSGSSSLVEWVSARAAGETEKELLTRGVPCSRVQQFEDVAASDWAAAVSLFRVLDHPHLGPRPLYTVPWHRDGGPSFAADRSSPLLASSTVDVLRGILGCTTEDIEALAEAEVVDIGAKESP